MLVDLGRNDVGRVAEFGSVRVPDLMVVERYSHVMHLVSQVEGELREGLSAMDVFKACFPAGTVSGAPKIRAMEIIDELEPVKRGPYAGAVGYFSFGGMNMDTAITIRTVVTTGSRAFVQAGRESWPTAIRAGSSTKPSTKPEPSSGPDPWSPRRADVGAGQGRLHDGLTTRSHAHAVHRPRPHDFLIGPSAGRRTRPRP